MPDSLPHSQRAYVIAVDMGYGHQRAAFPLLKMAAVPQTWDTTEPFIISANNYPGIPSEDRRIWSGTRKTYEAISRFDSIPILGKRIFHLMDSFHQIPPFYPRRDLSSSILENRETYKLIRRGRVGKHLIETLNRDPLPMVCTFPIPAFFAEEHGYKGDIYCLCTDTDLAHVWAPLNPQESRIIYLAPTVRAKERLKLYGVRPENIILTGFPLPQTTTEPEIADAALDRRIVVLDPRGCYRRKYAGLLDLYVNSALNSSAPPLSPPVTITFSVGGAGAQWEIGIMILKSLQQHIKSGRIRLILSAGALKNVKEKFEAAMKEFGVPIENNIVYAEDKFDYFRKFNAAMTQTDILWTKPSELSFFAGLGLPIIMAPPLGSQEESNRAWLLMVGAGIEQYDPRYADEWLMDWLESGWLAGAAVNGLLNTRRKAVRHIEDIVIRGQRTEIEHIHFL